MSISENIKRVRNEERLTQQEFADRIGVKRNTVATYEMGRSEPSDSAVMLICREFGVNEKWLRTGEGEMKVKRNMSVLDQLAQEFQLDDRSRTLIENFLRLSSENRKMVITAFENAAKLLYRKPDSDELTKAEVYEAIGIVPPPTKTDSELTREEKLSMIGEEIDAEESSRKKGATTSSASTGSSGTSKRYGKSP